LRKKENKVLSGTLGPSTGAISRWIKLHIQKIYNLYSSLNAILVIRSSRRQKGQVTYTGVKRKGRSLL